MSHRGFVRQLTLMRSEWRMWLYSNARGVAGSGITDRPVVEWLRSVRREKESWLFPSLFYSLRDRRILYLCTVTLPLCLDLNVIGCMWVRMNYATFSRHTIMQHVDRPRKKDWGWEQLTQRFRWLYPATTWVLTSIRLFRVFWIRLFRILKSS